MSCIDQTLRTKARFKMKILTPVGDLEGLCFALQLKYEPERERVSTYDVL